VNVLSAVFSEMLVKSNPKSYALVTGASSGIGLELAKVLAENKNNLVLVARSEQKLNELRVELEKKHGIIAHVICADLSDPSGPSQLVKAVREKNLEIDILVNNAGFGTFGEFATEVEWKKDKEMLQVNVVALTELCAAFIPDMVKRGRGKILNVASTAAFQPGPLMAVYFATKAYVLHFSEAIAEELESKGVSVTVLCPGATKSGFQAAADMHESKLVKDRNLPDSREVALFGYEAMMQEKRVVIHGMMNRLLALSPRFTPRNMVTKIARRFQERAN
jgi:short-subunit dehydrogenase